MHEFGNGGLLQSTPGKKIKSTTFCALYIVGDRRIAVSWAHDDSTCCYKLFTGNGWADKLCPAAFHRGETNEFLGLLVSVPAIGTSIKWPTNFEFLRN